jgi:Phosphate-selective porin O and P
VCFRSRVPSGSGRHRAFRRAAAAFLLLSLASAAARGQVLIKVNDTVGFRLGMLLQGWDDLVQDPVSEGYSQSLYLRRVRFIVAGTVARNVSFFWQVDNPRLGNAGTTGAKSLNTGFVTQDAFAEWKLAGDKLMLDAGLFYTPQSRGILNSSSSTLTFDAPAFGQQQNTGTLSSGGRDLGFALKGYLAGDRLEYRVGVFDGQRQAATTQGAGSRNPPRVAARIQYDVFDTEKGYTYVGTNRGAKKILAVGAWGDGQGDFKAWGADVMADIPIGKDAATAEADYLFYDGGRQFQGLVGGVLTPLLPKQKVFFTQAGYYVHALEIQPFVRYERLSFDADQFRTGDQQRYSAGLNWYIYGQNLKATVFYERIVPKTKAATARIKDTNHVGVQLQVLYF